MFSEYVLATSLQPQSCLRGWNIRRPMDSQLSVDPSSSTQVIKESSNSNIIQFNQTNIESHTLCITHNPNGEECILMPQSDKAVMHVYKWGKENVDLRFALPEKLSSLTNTSDHLYILGGGQTGQIYIWEISTGHLLAVTSAHYSKIRVIQALEYVVLTGGEDGVIHAWDLSEILDITKGSIQNSVQPLYSCNDHTLPITDIRIGVGNYSNARFVSSSLDRTCKLWEASSGQLLFTILFPTPIYSFAWVPTEGTLFAGGGVVSLEATIPQGAIYQVELYRDQRLPVDKVEVGQILHIGMSSESKHDIILKGHRANVTALELNFDGSLLVSGASDGQVIVWDIASQQILNQTQLFLGIVSNIQLVLKPEGSTNKSQVGQSYSSIHQKSQAIPSFQRQVLTTLSDNRQNEGGIPNCTVTLCSSVLDSEEEDREDYLSNLPTVPFLPSEVTINSEAKSDSIIPQNQETSNIAEMEKKLEQLQQEYIRLKAGSSQLYCAMTSLLKEKEQEQC